MTRGYGGTDVCVTPKAHSMGFTSQGARDRESPEEGEATSVLRRGSRIHFLRRWLLSWVWKDEEFRVHRGRKGHFTLERKGRGTRDLEATEQVLEETVPPKFSLRICVLSPPGGRDKVGRPLLLVSTIQEAWEAPWCTVSEVTKLLSYLCTVPR